MKVIVNIACGLANRMFQYSYYLYLKKLGYDVWVDFYRTAKLEHENVAWNSIFPNAPIQQASAWDVFLMGGGSNLVSRMRRRYLPFTCHVKTLSAFEAPLPEKSGNSVYMMGVFQNAKMVETVYNEVLDVFAFQPFADAYNLSLMREMQSCESVAIHVRKGKDYQARIWYQETCPVEYYQKAIRLMKEKIPHPKFYVFADNRIMAISALVERSRNSPYTYSVAETLAVVGAYAKGSNELNFDELEKFNSLQVSSSNTYGERQLFLRPIEVEEGLLYFVVGGCTQYDSGGAYYTYIIKQYVARVAQTEIIGLSELPIVKKYVNRINGIAKTAGMNGSTIEVYSPSSLV